MSSFTYYYTDILRNKEQLWKTINETMVPEAGKDSNTVLEDFAH